MPEGKELTAHRIIETGQDTGTSLEGFPLAKSRTM